MSLSEIIKVGLVAAAVLFGGYHYQQIHLPAFREVKAEVDYERCIRECYEVCKANHVPIDKCVCDNCRQYIEGD